MALTFDNHSLLKKFFTDIESILRLFQSYLDILIPIHTFYLLGIVIGV